MKAKGKYSENIELLDMLLKTEQFLSLKDDIVKDSFKAILSCLKLQNDKISQINIDLYDKITREEFNENIKHKVNFSDFMTQLNDLEEKEKKTYNNLETDPSTIKSKSNIYNYNNVDNLNKDIQNLKIEFAMFSKKIDNLMLFNTGYNPGDISVEEKDKILFMEMSKKLEKNEKDITELTVKLQNQFIKYDDIISNIENSQINKNELNQDIKIGLKKIEENKMKLIENEFTKIKNNLNKQITDTLLELNQNQKESNDNNNNINNIKTDLMLKEVMTRFNIFDETIKEMNSKFHRKIDKEEIIDIYSSIEELNNKIINQKNEIDLRLNQLKNNYKIEYNKRNDMENEINMDYFEKEIKNIKLNISDNFNLINNLKDEIISFQKDKNKLIENENNKTNNLENIYNYNTNIYPKNDFKNEVAYLKRFINTFMLEIKNENRKSNEIILDSLKEKMNIDDINKVLNEINIDMNNKLNSDTFNNQVQIQNDINNYLCKEHILGRWISYKTTLLKNAFIVWDEQLINLAPNNYCFTPNNTQLLIKKKGIYLIKIIVFNSFIQNNQISNVQLVIDREKIYNYSYIKHKIFINEENNKNNNNFFEESFIAEECIQVNNICRIEVRIDGFGLDNFSNREEFIYKDNKNIKAILNIISL